MKNFFKIFWLLVFFMMTRFACINDAFAQDTLSVKFEDLTLEELLNLKVTVSSGQKDLVSEAAGVVTIISSDEIKYSGSRDIIDVLRKVPGFDFAQDVENIIGPTVRGLWAQEGKMLFLVDGHEMHETAYGTLQFLQHYPIINVKQIEIIRGPGSVVYGGNAALAVVNIITRKGNEINGVVLSAQYGRFSDLLARRSVGISGGKSFKNGFSLSIAANLFDGNFSNQEFRDNDTLPLIGYKDSSGVSGNYINCGIDFKKIEFRYILDNLQHDVTEANFGYQHLSHIVSIRRKFSLSEKLSITPFLWNKSHYPWRFIDYHDSVYFENFYNVRTEGGLIGNYIFNSNFSLLAGARYQNDYSSYFEENTPLRFSYNGQTSVQFFNYSIYTQATLKWKKFILTPGLRYEKHNVYGAVLVPRINLSAQWNKFGFDIQYNEAFRAPTIINIDLNRTIKPERTYDKEIELNYSFNSFNQMAITFFYIDIFRPIIYTKEEGIETYFNGARTGSLGTEFSYRWKNEKNFLASSFSFYRPSNNLVDVFSVEQNSNVLIATPAVKIACDYTRQINKYLYFGVSGIYYGKRYGYNSVDEPFSQPETYLITAYVGTKALFDVLDLSIGMNDILDQRYKFIQAYRSGSGPLPGPGRELTVRLRWTVLKGKP
jgi:outer membrane receptor for ferrienterochelin and colicin